MQMSRKIASLLSSSTSQSRKWENLWTVPVLQSSMSTVSAMKASSTHLKVIIPPAQDVPKLGQIPWQPMVANSVNLIGYLGSPVQLGISYNDMHAAVSVLVNKKNPDLPQLRIPIIFRGDLAQIAVCNLRENDHVYVTGQLTGSVDHDAQGKIQVLVDNISYVVGLNAEMEYEKSSALNYEKTSAVEHKKSGALEYEKSSSVPDISSVSEKKFDKLSKTEASWVDLLENPEQWKDNRETEYNGKPIFPDFIHKSTGAPLWLVAVPEWVQSKLAFPKDGPLKVYVKSEFRACWKTREEIEDLWKNFLRNPEKWLDQRLCKMKPNYPDFKHKDSGEALWIGSSTTPWVHDRLLALRVSESRV